MRPRHLASLAQCRLHIVGEVITVFTFSLHTRQFSSLAK